MAGDGIFFAIDSVDRSGTRPEKILAMVSFRPMESHCMSRTKFQGANISVYVARMGDEWKVVRYGGGATG